MGSSGDCQRHGTNGMSEGPTWPTLMIVLACLLGSCKTGRTKDRVLQAAVRPALLSRRQPAGQKGCRHEGKLTKEDLRVSKGDIRRCVGEAGVFGPFDSFWVVDL